MAIRHYHHQLEARTEVMEKGPAQAYKVCLLFNFFFSFSDLLERGNLPARVDLELLQCAR